MEGSEGSSAQEGRVVVKGKVHIGLEGTPKDSAMNSAFLPQPCFCAVHVSLSS